MSVYEDSLRQDLGESEQLQLLPGREKRKNGLLH
jgi:hypothetical protein